MIHEVRPVGEPIGEMIAESARLAEGMPALARAQ